MGNKKDTVKAQKAHVKRDVRDNAKKGPQQTQGSISDAYIRHHTPQDDADARAIRGDD